MHDIKWKLKIWTATQKENKTIIWKIATTTKQKFHINIIILFCNFYLDNSVGFYILSMYHVLSVLIFAVSRGITLIRIILWLFTYFLFTVLSVLMKPAVVPMNWKHRCPGCTNNYPALAWVNLNLLREKTAGVLKTPA